MNRKDPVLPSLKGDIIRATHQASVTAILGAKAPPVLSYGTAFSHRARWTLRFLTVAMCDWAKANPGCCPTHENVTNWVRSVKSSPAVTPEIQIAATPERVTTRLTMALIGGAYHEALHGLLSCKRDLHDVEVADIVLPRWAKVPNWSGLTNLLLEWSNIVEDIRIERVGRLNFPGTFVKMCDLQDFILSKEELGRAKATEMGQYEATQRTLSIVASVFRDVGLGYNTQAQRLALSTYRKLNPAAVKMVLDGPLSPLLREALLLGAHDDTGSLRIAMDVVTALVALSEEGQKDQQVQEGQGEKVACPQCQAPPKALKVRPLSDGYGGKTPGKGLLVCTNCGYQEVIDLNESLDSSEDKPNDEAIEYEDIPQEAPEGGDSEGENSEGGDSESEDSEGGDSEGGDSEGGDSEGENSEGENSEGGDSEGGDSEGGDSEGGDSESEGSKGEDSEGEDSEGEDSEGEDSEGWDSEGEDSEGEDSKSEDSKSEDSKSEDSKSEDSEGGNPPDKHPGKHVGGGHHDTGIDAWTPIADETLASAEEGSGIHDANTALADAFNEELTSEDASCERGEAPWRPLDPSLDSVHLVRPADKGGAKSRSDALLRSVKRESSYLRARLRNIVLALEQTALEHGLRRGKGLSQRMLVDSKCAILGGQAPDRAYYDISDQIDTSLAAAVVIDESRSMSSNLKDATRVMMAITEPLDSLGCPVQVSGFRNGSSYQGSQNIYDGTLPYHRADGIRHDVFKTFDERFNSVRHRFSCTQATGGTPMADGVKFGLDGLSDRLEAHRVLFVVTDGCPNGGHLPVIRHLIRIANEAGIHVVGVGLGPGAQYVKDVFPDYVYSRTLSKMPKELIRKLNQLLDFRGAKRGRRMKKVS